LGVVKLDWAPRVVMAKSERTSSEKECGVCSPDMRIRTILCAVALTLLHLPMPSARQQTASATWPQWGGPHRDFTTDSKGLAAAWPAGGPKKLWSRALGEGHSAVASDGARLYTMYRPLGMLAAIRRSQEEVVAALDPRTGATDPPACPGPNFSRD